MARAGLDWSVRDLAAHAQISPNTISRYENGKDAYGDTLAKLEQVLSEAGADFLPDNGVRIRKREEQKI